MLETGSGTLQRGVAVGAPTLTLQASRRAPFSRVCLLAPGDCNFSRRVILHRSDPRRRSMETDALSKRAKPRMP